jgi:hypothetical protein
MEVPERMADILRKTQVLMAGALAAREEGTPEGPATAEGDKKYIPIYIN